MKKLLAVCTLALVPVLGFASSEPPLDQANIDLRDQASLQRGAKYFTSYCMGCHSLQYLRYNRMAADLGISDADLKKNFLVGETKPGEPMTISTRPADAEKWFGVAVPDLTLVTRWRSPDWVYTYLKSFYVDPTRAWGVNNVVFPAVSMPHVLGDLQGRQEPVMAHHGEGTPVIEGVKLVTPGKLSPEQYDAMVRDITNFLTYAGEPMQLERKQLGLYVLLFLILLSVIGYFLKKEYWKDVH